jgi:MoaA/NifB/PqqE/SkfB family radical SAM enzyme
MEILYKVHNNLYVNLTNKCPYSCTFCLRQTMDRIGESGRLWLEREPSYDDVIAEFEKFNMDEYIFKPFIKRIDIELCLLYLATLYNGSPKFSGVSQSFLGAINGDDN